MDDCVVCVIHKDSAVPGGRPGTLHTLGTLTLGHLHTWGVCRIRREPRGVPRRTSPTGASIVFAAVYPAQWPLPGCGTHQVAVGAGPERRVFMISMSR